LLLFGGSQGSRAINDAMIAALPHLDTHRGRLHVTHQTGSADFAKVRDAYAERGWTSADVREYIDDMMNAFAANDLIVSRAGATTSAELMAAGKAAIMIPLPGQLEQQRNAEALQSAGGARMILQDELSGERLAREIDQLEKVIANSQRQLSNEAFRAKAPEKVVSGMIAKQAEYEAQLAKLRAAL